MNHDKTLRILQIIDNISVDAGVSSMIMNIYRKIDRTKLQFDFLVCNKAEDRGKNYESEIRQLGGKVFYFGSPLSIESCLSSVRNADKFFKERGCVYRAVHLHTPTIAEFTLKYAKKYGIKIRIVHSHSTMLSTNRIKTIINKYLVSRIKRYATDYWACSTEAAKFLYGEKFVLKHGVELIWNCVEPEKYLYDEKVRNSMREKYGIKNKYVITHISNFTVIKNHFFLIDVIKKVVKKNKNVMFCFIGDGDMRYEFENRLREEGVISYCVFIGRTTSIPEYLSCSDLVILPSIKEGLPVTIVEAQANGVKCILSDSITRECDVSDCIFLPLDVDTWASSIIKNSFDKKSDRKKRSEIFRNSKFNIARQIVNIENIYFKVCGYE